MTSRNLAGTATVDGRSVSIGQRATGLGTGGQSAVMVAVG
jgi:hypothetical protein